MKLGKILGFPITLDPSWFLVFAMVVALLMQGSYPRLFDVQGPNPGVALAVAGALLLFGSVLVHELAHSLVGRARGVEIEGITLFIFGGIARLKDEPRKPGVEFWMTAAGPAASAVLAAAFYGLARAGLALNWPLALVSILGYVSIANQTIAIFNMIPAFPLDGGRILRSLLWGARKDVVAATRWASHVSRTLAYAVIAMGSVLLFQGNIVGLWQIFMGMFVLSAATAAYRQVFVRNRLESVSVASLLPAAGRAIPASTPLNWVMDEYMLGEDQTAFPVMEGETLRGTLSIEDIQQVPLRQWPWTTAIEVCQPLTEESAIDARTDAWQALTKMLAGNARRLLVLREGRIMGVLTRDQVLRLLHGTPNA